MMADSPRPVKSSVRIYRLLVKLYPAAFRKQFGDQMVHVFDQLAADTFRRQGTAGLALAWFRVLGDLVATAPVEHLTELKRRPDMKATALTLLAILAAAVVNLYVMVFTGIVIGIPLELFGGKAVGMVLVFYLSAFLTGMILARVKPFYMPRLTAPLGAMALISIGLVQEAGVPWWARIGILASLGLVSLAGCIAATKIPPRLQRFSVSLFNLGGTMAVLVCTSSVGFVLWLILTGNELGQPMRPTLIVCLYALGLIGVLATANLVHAAVKQPEKAELT